MCPVLDFIVIVKLEPEVREKDMRLCWGLERRERLGGIVSALGLSWGNLDK